MGLRGGPTGKVEWLGLGFGDAVGASVCGGGGCGVLGERGGGGGGDPGGAGGSRASRPSYRKL